MPRLVAVKVGLAPDAGKLAPNRLPTPGTVDPRAADTLLVIPTRFGTTTNAKATRSVVDSMNIKLAVVLCPTLCPTRRRPIVGLTVTLKKRVMNSTSSRSWVRAVTTSRVAISNIMTMIC